MQTDQQPKNAIPVPTKREKRNVTYRIDPALSEWLKQAATEQKVSQAQLLEAILRNAQLAVFEHKPED